MKALPLIGSVCLATLMLLGLLPTDALGRTAGDGAAATPGLVQRLWLLTGTFHPMIVHFPIALLLVAALMEGARLKFKNISPDVVYWCIVIGALGSIVSAVFGWSRATTWSANDEVLFNHRWLGVGITILAVCLAIVATVARKRPEARVWQRVQMGGVFVAAGFVGLVGHLGGELTYGEGFVQDAIAKAIFPPEPEAPKTPIDIPKIEPIKEEPKVVETPANPSVQPDASQSPMPISDALEKPPQLAGGGPTRVDFQTQIWPIFQSKCLECHGEKKAKGKLRMDNKTDAIKGGKGGPLWVGGKSGESLILKRLVTDPDNPEERMPPLEAGEVVTPEEYELIRRWIDEGADWPVLPPATTTVTNATSR